MGLQELHVWAATWVMIEASAKTGRIDRTGRRMMLCKYERTDTKDATQCNAIMYRTTLEMLVRRLGDQKCNMILG